MSLWLVPVAESGASLRAAGYQVVAQRPARAGWHTPSRPRTGRGVDGVQRMQRVLDARAGTRNWALNTAAWNLGRLVADGLLDRNEVEDTLCHAGVAAGYRDGPRAVAAVVRCALDARLRQPAGAGPGRVGREAVGR